MADNKKFEATKGVGDITQILHNQSVADLSWLAVDEQEYRAAETLPKQNLDIIPELVHALAREDGVPQVIPLKPHTIVNRNPSEQNMVNKIDSTSAIRNRVAKLVMSDLSLPDIETQLRSEFSSQDLSLASDTIREVISERGLLGNIYVNSNHFPRCHQGTIEDRKFVSTHGKRALFVLSNQNCADCVHNSCGTCSVFKKNIVDEIPYNLKTLAHFATQLANEKRPIEKVSSKSEVIKHSLRIAFLKSPIGTSEAPRTIHTQHKSQPTQITKDDVQRFLSSKETVPGFSVEYIKFATRMMQGKDDRQIISCSKDESVRDLAKQFGILGHTYFDSDVIGSCSKTLSLIRGRFGSNLDLYPEIVVRRAKTCPECNGCEGGACHSIGMFASVVDSVKLNKFNVARALMRARARGFIAHDSFVKVVASLKTRNVVDINASISFNNTRSALVTQPVKTSSSQLTAHYGDAKQEDHIDLDQLDKYVSHLMNTGVGGRELVSAVLSKYSRPQLASARETLTSLLQNDKIQGEYYIDPTAYSDYGRGCDEGSSHFRKRGAPFVLASSSCTGCQLQTHPGWCSKYSKNMIRSVPEKIKIAIHEAKKKLPVIQSSHIENPVDSWQLSADIQIPASQTKADVVIEIADKSIDQ